jgi:hypothetical protein
LVADRSAGEVPRYASSITSRKNKRKVEFHDGASSSSSSSSGGLPKPRTRFRPPEPSRTVRVLFYLRIGTFTIFPNWDRSCRPATCHQPSPLGNRQRRFPF